ncbi:hypothetical protein LCGC14_0957270 [marine sediment metagenome]|uniref:Uncharacterized protein n=1 Tax=marine sediment metagenome TaxID=412755 RepID=A0A0F9NK72_9ZZZZ
MLNHQDSNNEDYKDYNLIFNYEITKRTPRKKEKEKKKYSF